MKRESIELKINKLKAQLSKLYDAYIKSVFKENENLKSFYLESYEDYNDSNHFSAIAISEINGIKLPTQIRSEYDVSEFEDNPGYKSFLLESDLNIKTIYRVLSIIDNIPVEYLSEKYCFKEIKAK